MSVKIILCCLIPCKIQTYCSFFIFFLMVNVLSNSAAQTPFYNIVSISDTAKM